MSSDVLDELADRDYEVLLLEDSGFEKGNDRTARIGGGPEYFVSQLSDRPYGGPEHQPINREFAERMVGSWDVVGFETASTPTDFEPPAWVLEYPTTTFRGSTLYPAPADWIFKEPEGLALAWTRYPGVGEVLTSDYDIDQAFEDDYEGREDARAETAYLIGEVIDSDRSERTETVEWELTIDGQTIFRRVNPTRHARLEAVSAALARYSGGEDIETLADRIVPATGRVPEDIRQQRDLERRREVNQSLGEFTSNTGGDPDAE